MKKIIGVVMVLIPVVATFVFCDFIIGTARTSIGFAVVLGTTALIIGGLTLVIDK